MPPTKDLTGQRFGKLLITGHADRKPGDDSHYWHFTCDCGNNGKTSTRSLTIKRSCGCGSRQALIDSVQSKVLDLTGQRFGRLTVLEPAESKNNRRCWKCICDCGNTHTAKTACLREGNTQSCGCLAKEVKTTHGLRDTKENEAWRQMKARCYNTRNHNYCRYGARGITVCDNWKESFLAFYEDMGPAPEGTSLERINNDLGYSKENCKWAIIQEQAHNRRDNKLDWDKVKDIRYRYQELGQTITAIAQHYGVTRSCIRRVVSNRGWKVEDYPTPTSS